MLDNAAANAIVPKIVMSFFIVVILRGVIAIARRYIATCMPIRWNLHSQSDRGRERA